MTIAERVHESVIVDRRIRILGDRLARVIPADASVLDVGCGNGMVAHAVGQQRPDLTFSGIEVLQRPDTLIDVRLYDGLTIPYADDSADVVMMVDMLHHTENPSVLLREARRVATRAVVIKDHTLTGRMSGPTLRFMGRVGNARSGVALPYTYWTRTQWREAFDSIGLDVDAWNDRLGLYWWPASLLFERQLHFVARLIPLPRLVA